MAAVPALPPALGGGQACQLVPLALGPKALRNVVAGLALPGCHLQPAQGPATLLKGVASARQSIAAAQVTACDRSICTAWLSTTWDAFSENVRQQGFCRGIAHCWLHCLTKSRVCWAKGVLCPEVHAALPACLLLSVLGCITFHMPAGKALFHSLCDSLHSLGHLILLLQHRQRLQQPVVLLIVYQVLVPALATKAHSSTCPAPYSA